MEQGKQKEPWEELMEFLHKLHDAIKHLEISLKNFEPILDKCKEKETIGLFTDPIEGPTVEQIAEQMVELRMLVNLVESLAEKTVSSDQECHKQERILALTQEFDAKSALMPKSTNGLSQMQATMDAFQVEAENVILELIPELNQPTSDQGDPKEMDMSEPRQYNIRVSVAQAPNNEAPAAELFNIEIPAANQQESSETNNVQENGTPMQVDETNQMALGAVGGQSEQTEPPKESPAQLSVQANENAAPPTVSALANQALSSIICTEFSYKSLVKFNHALNNLQQITEMPERAMGAHFRNLRNLLTRFLALCQTLKIDLRFLEVVLISHIIGTFNEMVFSNWKFFMRSNNASLISIREFLTIQEEIATDEWMQESRLILSSAVKAAQRMVCEPQMQPVSEPQKPPTFKIPLVSKGEPAKKAVDAQPQRSYANVASENNAGCSYWPGGARPKTPAQPPAKSPKPRDSSVGSNKSNKASDKKQENNKKRCLYCGEGHFMFYCSQYIGLSLRDRTNYVERNQICPLCLRARHNVSNCTDGICTNCEEPHNSTLCPISIRKKLLQKRKREQEKKE